MPRDLERKRIAMAKVHAVESILRQWDPIGFSTGEASPQDQYDSYAPHIVSLVTTGASVNELASHLSRLRTEAIGWHADPERDQHIASAILAVLSPLVV